MNAKLRFLAGLLCSFFVATSAHALLIGTPAVSFTGGTSTISFATTFGYSFEVNTPLTVTALGVWDSQGDGLVEDHTVGIFTTSGSTPLASATVPSGTLGTLIDGFRYVSITDFLLNPGTYNIGAFYPLGLDPVIQNASTVTTDPRITYQQGGFDVLAGSLANPTTPTAAANSSFGPNFLIAPAATSVPEPGTLALVGLAVGGLAFSRRRKAA
jgi:hypothetical protein